MRFASPVMIWRLHIGPMSNLNFRREFASFLGGSMHEPLRVSTVLRSVTIRRGRRRRELPPYCFRVEGLTYIISLNANVCLKFRLSGDIGGWRLTGVPSPWKTSNVGLFLTSSKGKRNETQTRMKRCPVTFIYLPELNSVGVLFHSWCWLASRQKYSSLRREYLINRPFKCRAIS